MAAVAGPSTRSLVDPVFGSPTYRSPFEVYGMRPFAAGPNGGAGLEDAEPATITAMIAATRSSASATPRRHGTRGAAANRRVMADIGNHLSGKVHPGRWRVAAVRAKRSSA